MVQGDTTHYETVIILRQDLSNAQAQEFVDKTKKELLKAKANISREESWGLRNLSYPIRKNKKGHYFLLNHSNSSEITQEMERVLRLNENLLRLLTIRTEEPVNEPSSMTIQGQNENIDDERGAPRAPRQYGEKYNNDERNTPRASRQYGEKYNNDERNTPRTPQDGREDAPQDARENAPQDAREDAPQDSSKEQPASETQSRDAEQMQPKNQE